MNGCRASTSAGISRKVFLLLIIHSMEFSLNIVLNILDSYTLNLRDFLSHFKFQIFLASFTKCFDVLHEFHRKLKTSGIIRIIVPDAELYLDLYQKNKSGENVDFPYVDEKKLQSEFTAMMAINRVFREHGHLFAYDFRTLSLMLERAGFQDIRKESFMVGRNEKLLIDSEERAIESLYIEACT